jgi:hypothetical protein
MSKAGRVSPTWIVDSVIYISRISFLLKEQFEKKGTRTGIKGSLQI